MRHFLRFLFVLLVFVPISVAQADFGPPPPPPPGGGGPLPPGGGSGGSGGGSGSVASNSSTNAISNGAIVIGTAACMAGSAILDDAVVDVGTFVQYSLVPCAAAGGAVYLVVASGGAAAPAIVVGVVVYYGGRYFLEIFPPHASFKRTLLAEYPYLSDAEIQFRCSEVRKNHYKCGYDIPGITTP